MVGWRDLPPRTPPPLMAAIAGHSRVMCAMCGPWGTTASSFFSMIVLAASFLRHQHQHHPLRIPSTPGLRGQTSDLQSAPNSSVHHTAL
jgi:hypothetical protein